ncbi:MAG: cytochrome c1 [Neisseria sp.]|nr:cytochrome c1 [Neisseria sp.]
MKTRLKALLLTAVLAVAPFGTAAAAGAGFPAAPVDLRDQASLQRGAQIFANYCLSCHSANGIRYNRLTDLGLTEDQIKNNLIFTDAKIGDTMGSAMTIADGKAWFGVAPPDLTLMARSRGADYLYAYLRGFYKDPTGATGWNNTVFPKAGMPHILWEQGGIQAVELDANGQPVMVDDGHGVLVPKLKWTAGGLHTTLKSDGTADTQEFDAYVGDLVNYMVWMGEPSQLSRHRIGYLVLMFLLAIMLPLTYFLKKEYWKDVEH